MYRNFETGIRYCAPEQEIGFRGVVDKKAVLIPLLGESEKSEKEIFLPRGVDVPVSSLPYLPDMGKDSDYIKKGYWHHYKIKKAVFIIFLNEKGYYYEVLHVVQFEEEDTPRILKDEREKLFDEGTLYLVSIKHIESILEEKGIVLN